MKKPKLPKKPKQPKASASAETWKRYETKVVKWNQACAKKLAPYNKAIAVRDGVKKKVEKILEKAA